MKPELEMFHCKPLHATLSRKSCGTQWRKANVGAARGEDGKGIVRPACYGCPVGEQHAAGEQPDVERADIDWSRSAPKASATEHQTEHDAGEQPAREEAMEARTCRGCGVSFAPEQGAQKYCRTCRPAKPKGHAAGKRKRQSASAEPGDTPLRVADRIVELLEPLDAADKATTLDLVHVALGHGTVRIDSEDAA